MVITSNAKCFITGYYQSYYYPCTNIDVKRCDSFECNYYVDYSDIYCPQIKCLKTSTEITRILIKASSIFITTVASSTPPLKNKENIIVKASTTARMIQTKAYGIEENE